MAPGRQQACLSPGQEEEEEEPQTQCRADKQAGQADRQKERQTDSQEDRQTVCTGKQKVGQTTGQIDSKKDRLIDSASEAVTDLCPASSSSRPGQLSEQDEAAALRGGDAAAVGVGVRQRRSTPEIVSL